MENKVYMVTLTYTALVVANDALDAERVARDERREICGDIEPEIETQGDILTLEELKAMDIGWSGNDYPYGDDEARLSFLLPEKLEPIRCDKTGEMFPEQLPEEKPCFQSMAAAKKLGADPAWRWCIAEAPEAAREFIVNGIELGAIRMPDDDTPDTAHDTLPMIEAAIAAWRGNDGEK